MTSISPIAPAATSALSSNQNILVLREGERPPAPPPGFEWKLTASLESLPPKNRFELRPVTAGAPSTATPKAGDTLRLREGEAPPAAPAGFEWQLKAELESLPPQYLFELVEKKAAPSADLVDTLVDAYSDGRVTSDEVRKLIGAASADGVSSDEVSLLQQAFVKTTRAYDPQSARAMRLFLIDHGVPGE